KYSVRMIGETMKQSLGELVKAARKQGECTLERLAEKVGKEPQWISSIEKGSGIPSAELLIKIHEALVPEGESSPTRELGVWLLKWTEAKLERERGKPNARRKENDAGNKLENERLNAKGKKAISKFYAQSIRSNVVKRSTSALPTLADFPDAFDDLLVVCGDRRESPPKTKGDIFADSFSSADLAHVRHLFDRCGRPLDIRSDKGFILGDRDYLKREFGERHLIVLGSPAVNLLARMINDNCVFRFAIPRAARDFSQYLETQIPEINDPDLLDVFWKMASQWREAGGVEIDTEAYYEPYLRKAAKIQMEQIQAVADKVKELLNDHTAKRIKHMFHKPGFIDTADAQQHGESPRQDNDFGVVSLCPNPYSESGNHLCILVAGIHAPGTDQALRALATDDFREHPLGGIIEAKINLQAGWIERLYKAGFDWQTKAYGVDTVLANLADAPNLAVFEKCTPEAISNLSKFVAHFVEADTTTGKRPSSQSAAAGAS
ncbi:MAG: helix-turn-helix domain-containing protein, partial [Pyrinomonadaceae bacterium]